jgi:hypothetical protein
LPDVTVFFVHGSFLHVLRCASAGSAVGKET